MRAHRLSCSTYQLFPDLGGEVGRMQNVILGLGDIVRVMRQSRRYWSLSLPGVCLRVLWSVLTGQQPSSRAHVGEA